MFYTGILFLALYFLLHSLDSMLAASATNVSLVKPLMLFTFLSKKYTLIEKVTHYIATYMYYPKKQKIMMYLFDSTA